MPQYEFKLIGNLYGGDVDNPKIIKTNLITRWLVDLDDIRSICESYNSKGKIHKNRCIVYHKDEGYKVVLGSYDKIVKLKLDTRIKGFMQNNK
jgi:hypothetical protein